MMADVKDWRSRMATARFGSFEFKTENHDAKFGRRLVVHEFPGADMPVVEDFGEKAREWNLNAYFIGDNYDEKRDQFLEILNTQGADWLIHPWLGRVWARPHTWSVHESNDKGGYCAVTVNFVHGGQTDSAPTVDRVDVAYDRLKKLSSAAVADFKLEPMSAEGMTAFIAAVHKKLDVLRKVISLATLPLTWANQIRGLVAGVKGDLAALMALPSAYASALRGLANDFGLGSDRSDVSDTDRPRIVARALAAAVSGRSVVLGELSTASAAVRRNLVQEEALRNRLLVVSAAQIALADYRAEADRDAALASVTGAIDALLPGMADPVFHAAVAARVALIDALMAQDLKPASQRDVAGNLPAVVLAHRMGIDEAVFMARNQVRHPLFVKGRIYG